MTSRPTVALKHIRTHRHAHTQALAHKISLAIHANLRENDLLISKTLKPLDRPLKPSRFMVVYYTEKCWLTHALAHTHTHTDSEEEAGLFTTI